MSNKKKRRSVRSKLNRQRKQLKQHSVTKNNRTQIEGVRRIILDMIPELQHKFHEIRDLFETVEQVLSALACNALGEELTEQQTELLRSFLPEAIVAAPEPESDQEQLELPLESVGNEPTSEETEDFVQETGGSDFGEHGQ